MNPWVDSRNHSAPTCGTIPQGKGREGIRKGSGRERYRNSACGSRSNSISLHAPDCNVREENACNDIAGWSA